MCTPDMGAWSIDVTVVDDVIHPVTAGLPL
jgi:hypothetical protein